MTPDGRAEPLPPTAIVTGGAGGIGLAVSRRLAQAGYALRLIDIDERALDRAGAELSCHTMAGDVSLPEIWGTLAADIQERGDDASLLVNAAGVLLAGRLAECEPEQIEQVVRINLLGTLYGCRELASLMAAGNRPTPLPRGMLNVASVFATVSPPGFAVYSASKAGVVAATEALRGELAPRGLQATVVLPGVAPTGLFDRARYAEPAFRPLVDQYLAEAELTAERVAEQAIGAYRRGRTVAVIGRRAGLYAWLKRLAPERVIAKLGRRVQGLLAD